MKTFGKFAALIPLLAACGGAAPRANFNETQCSTALRVNATSVEVRQAVNDVLDGRVDPCDGAATGFRANNVSLERIDMDAQRALTLVFRVSAN